MIPDNVKLNQKWCVSKDKMPLDIFALKKGYEWGASFKRTHSAYGTYDDAKRLYDQYGYKPTLFVDSSEQSIYMIDIEPTCPQQIRQAVFKSLKDSILYIEHSMSGNGYHAMVLVDCGGDKLRTLKYKQWFEILVNHHCTFTLDEIGFDQAYSEDRATNEFVTDDDADAVLIEKLETARTGMEFYDLIRGDKPVVSAICDNATMQEFRAACAGFDGRHADLFGLLCDVEYDKTVDGEPPNGFRGDYSRYEFGYASKLHYALIRIANNMIDADARCYVLKVDRNQAIMLVYMVLKQMLPHRAKHDEVRNGLPWLLFTSHQVYMKSFGDGSGKEG